MKKRKYNSTETAPLKWAHFEYLRAELQADIENESSPTKRTALAKMAAGIVMGCYFGLRFSDLSRITWLDILDQKSLLLTEQKTRKKRGIEFNKNVEPFVAMCYQQSAFHRVEEPILSNRWGAIMSIAYFNRRLSQIFDKHKIQYLNASSHTLRKTFGRKVFENQHKSHEALLLLSKIFNHATTTVTSRYIGITGEQIREAYINLD